ncbi:MAG: hypothetical protein AMXMBFR7_15300 [Planctomycetota bacterium]
MRKALIVPMVLAWNLLFAAEPPPLVTQKTPVRVWVDQIGFRPSARKLLVVASDAALPAGQAFELCEAESGKTVLAADELAKRLKVSNGGQKDGASGDFVTHLDLSDFETPGRYYVKYQAGGGAVRSCAFNIAPDVYKETGLAAWKSIYWQRADCEKPAPYAEDWTHGPAFLGPKQAKEAQRYVWKGARHFEPVGDTPAGEQTYDVSGGWWDAGDFSKYTGNTVRFHNDLLLAAQLVKDQLADKQLTIPEAGNGVPDFLDEIRYGTEYLIRLHDGTGAAFGRVYEQGGCPPDSVKSPVQLTEVTSSATMARAAALAYAAAVWNEFKLDEPFAAKCLAEAKRSWDLLQTKPHPWPADPKKPGHVQYTGDWFALDYGQMRALYAASLFRIEKSETWERILREEAAKWPAFEPAGHHDVWPAIWLHAHSAGADAALADSMKKKVLDAARTVVQWTGPGHGYAMKVKGYWWGSNALVGRTGSNAILAAELCADPNEKAKFLEAAEEYVHYLLGRNAIGACFLTNMKRYGAENSAMVMFHAWVGADGKPESAKFIGEGPGKVGPFPGTVVGGVNGSMKRYTTELHWTKNPWEFTENDITYQSPCATLLAYFGLKMKDAGSR